MYRTALIVLLLIASPCAAASLEVNGDLQWTGQPTSDGSETWPTTLTMDFGGNFSTANVTLDTMPYFGAWMTEDFGMTSGSARIFSTDGVTIALEMNPLAELTEATLADVLSVNFQWAHPQFNGPAPISWLTLEGSPSIVVPEPSGLWPLLAMLLLGMASLALARLGPRK